MPRGSRIDSLPSALTASKSAAYLWDEDYRGQSVHIHVGPMLAGLAGRDHGVNAVYAHVRQGHWRLWLFTPDHSPTFHRGATFSGLAPSTVELCLKPRADGCASQRHKVVVLARLA